MMKIYVLTFIALDKLGREHFKEIRIISKQLTEDEYTNAVSEFKLWNDDLSNIALINSLELLR